MRLAWLTDIHLDFLDEAKTRAFGAKVAAEGADGVLITGDISVARALGRHLAQLVSTWTVPCWFVAGNHDYYGASIDRVRAALRQMREIEPRLRWLPSEGVVTLAEGVALVGVDGWADGRLGDPEGTNVVLNDHIHIEDLVWPTRGELLEVVRALGDEEAARLSGLLERALETHTRIHVATHIPPFREASTFQGQVSGDAWLPWMTCHAVGERLRAVAEANPSARFTVFAGHTHDRHAVRVLPNLEVRTGRAAYRSPAIEDVLTIEPA